MPIYEFKCLTCNEHFEFLFLKSDDEIEPRCPKCKSEDFERVVSTTNYSIGNSKGGSGVKSESRTCSSGSCTTYEIPGHSR